MAYTQSMKRVSDLAAEVRQTVAVHPQRTGWVIRPHHTNRTIQIGHKQVNELPYLKDEAITMIQCLDQLGTFDMYGYEVVYWKPLN
ncbi:predicted protein [Cyanophage PSS2]|uniref:hypothetical protein n=1 Tax=Cyanophage PSS2 TaxID=658401 RepID=UPI0001B03FDE|nr:hypothetical protein PSS2_gp008 [Cyanophage PSS2]ACT65570.1 hypothetical protein [Cyanophage PSS2]ACY75714.1 predicted protein [Cyanophage PSS2]